MIVDVKKAILHILDCNSGAGIFSDEEMDMSDAGLNAYLTKHIEKVYDDPGIRTGEFTESSGFKYHLKEYLADEITFAKFSLFAAERLYENIKNSENIESCDIVVCECIISEKRTIAVLKFDNKVGFVHHVTQQDGKITNEIINHYAILTENNSLRIYRYRGFIDTLQGQKNQNRGRKRRFNCRRTFGMCI